MNKLQHYFCSHRVSYHSVFHIFSITIVTVVLALSLTACGGSSNNDDNPPGGATTTLSGTVATGAPFAGTLNITGSAGELVQSVVIAADGSYSADITGLTAPFMLQAIPTDATQASLYSYAAAANTIANVSQLTTLALFMANGNADLATYYAAWASSAAAFAQQALLSAQAAVNANLATLLQANGLDYLTYDFLTTAFTASSTGIDAVLDNTTVDLGGGNIAVSVAGDASFSFDPNIDISAINIGGSTTTSFSVGGTVSGATSKFVLQNSNGDSLSVTGTSFTFPTALANGASYSASVTTQPLNETCTVTNGSGTINGADVNDINVTCLATGGGATYTIGGAVNGNISAISLELQKNDQTINDLPSFAGGNFSFLNTFDSGENYAVIITSQPTGQNCTLSNASGTIANADIINVIIACADNNNAGAASGTLSTPAEKRFDFSKGRIPALTNETDIRISTTSSEGVNFRTQSTTDPRRYIRLARSGSLSAVPTVPLWNNRTPWVTASWDYRNGTGGQPLAVGEIWAVYTTEGNYAVLQVTSLPDGNFGNSFTFDYLYQPDGTRDF